MKHPDVYAHELRIVAAMGGYSREWRNAREVEYRDLWARLHPSAEQLEEIAFIRRMKARQGTVLPDFDALYAGKAELDRQLLGESPHDRT